MSTDYRMSIHRKIDNKILGVVDCNQIKAILDNPKFANVIGCDSRYDSDKAKFEYKDLEEIEDLAYEELEKVISRILEKKMMIMNAKSTEVLEHLEDELQYIYSEELSELKYEINLVGEIEGMILSITQDSYKNPMLYSEVKDHDDNTINIPASKYNASDLDVKEDMKHIYTGDVYLQLERC